MYVAGALLLILLVLLGYSVKLMTEERKPKKRLTPSEAIRDTYLNHRVNVGYYTAEEPFDFDHLPQVAIGTRPVTLRHEDNLINMVQDPDGTWHDKNKGHEL